MGILNDLLDRVQGVNNGLESGEIVRDVMLGHPDDILDLQRQQLFAGLTSTGEDVRPYYSEDLKPGGYFTSVEKAKNYAAWKGRLNYPYNANRNPDAPNLYINGRFHDELGVQYDSDTVGIIGATSYAKGIVEKYGLRTFGLMISNWMVIFAERGALDELMNKIKTMLYGN